MTIYEAKQTVFKITDTGSTLRELTKYVIELDGLPGPNNMVDVMAFADDGLTTVKGKPEVRFTGRFVWSNDANVGSDTVLGALHEHTSPTAFEYGPHGDASGAIKYSGNCWVEEYSGRTVVNNNVECTATFQVQGKVTRGTFT